MYNKTLKKNDIKKKINKKKTLKKKSLMKIESIKLFDKTIKNNYNSKSSMTYNSQFIKLLSELEELMKKNEFFRARAYTKAKEKLILYSKPITDVNELKGIKGIGNTILNKLQEYVDTGTLQVLLKAKKNPVYIFTDVYGIGPKKANELVKKHNIKTIDELRERQDELLNDVQKKGLKYYEDVLKEFQEKKLMCMKKN